ncbi:MAG TPA: molybdenum cofactor biosynthesis protein MoaE [Candidatus Bathyarchaeia archaeon]|nr:molybdenum cofactor biosynthesis protein MoaE [Candidatus Bathyarchaeia archaeon]
MTTHAGVHEKGTLSILDLISNIKKSDNFEKAGAIALFIGVARGETLEREKVQKLTLEAYEEKANEVLAKICDDLSRKPGIVDVQIHHLLGEFHAGEDLVYVLVAGSHRTDVFPVLREAVERYKSEAPVFKKERVVDAKGSATEYWVSEKESKEP